MDYVETLMPLYQAFCRNCGPNFCSHFLQRFFLKTSAALETANRGIAPEFGFYKPALMQRTEGTNSDRLCKMC